MSAELLLASAQTTAANFDEGAALALSSSNKFLGRFQLFGSNSDACKEGKIGIGQYGIVSGDNLQVLSDTVHAFVVSVRLKALRIAPGNKIYNYFNYQSDQFKAVVNESEEKDSGCMAGQEFLLYVPSVEKFCTFFMCSKTSKKEAPNVKKLLGKPATFKSKLIKTPKYSWHGPYVLDCTEAISLEVDPTEFATTVNEFNNPVESADSVGPNANSEATDGRAR